MLIGKQRKMCNKEWKEEVWKERQTGKTIYIEFLLSSTWMRREETVKGERKGYR